MIAAAVLLGPIFALDWFIGSSREAASERLYLANIDKILTLEPDLVLTFSDLQADIAATHEVKSSLILQPGPAALTDGLAELWRIIERWATRNG